MAGLVLPDPKSAIGGRAPKSPFVLRATPTIPLPFAAWSSIPGRVGLRDLTRRGNDLAVVGTAPTVVPSAFGVPVIQNTDQAADYLEATGISETFGSGYSYSFLAKWDAAPTASSSWWRKGTVLGAFGFSYGHALPAFSNSCFHELSGGSYVAAKLTTSLQADTWYWIGGTWDGSTVRAYLNGVEEASVAAASIEPETGGVEIAINEVNGNPAWTLLDFFLWSTVLSAAQIRALHEPRTRWQLYRQNRASVFLPRRIKEYLIAGDVVVSVIPEAVMLYNINPVIAGDVVATVVPEAVMLYQPTTAIVGDLVISVVIAAAMVYEAAPFVWSEEAAITGAWTPEAEASGAWTPETEVSNDWTEEDPL